MRHVCVPWAVLLLSAAAGACRDFSAPDAAALVPLPAVRALAQQQGASWEVPGKDPYACFVSTQTPRGPMAYRYHRLKLRLPKMMEDPTGAVAAYSYRLQRPDGTILRVVNCVIPRTAEAFEHLNQRLRIRGQTLISGSVNFEAGCVGTSQTDIYQGSSCTIGTLVAVAESTPPAPEDDPECTINGCIGGPPIGGGGGGGGGGTDPYSGGSLPCTNCGPEAPRMTCTTVTREQIATCTIGGSGESVVGLGWAFTGGGHTIPGPDMASTWEGPAVLSGTVTAASFEDPGQTLGAALTVRPRTWRWGIAQWNYTQGTAYPCDTRVISPGVAMGWNIPIGDATCNGTYHLRVQPDPRRSGAGSVVGRLGFGPNNGLMYIDTVTFRMDRNSNMNAQMGPAGQTLPLSGIQASLCGPAANWRAFNLCQGVNVTAIVNGVWNHEGFGSNGNNGHESTARHAASQLANDPYDGAEPFVGAPGESDVIFRNRMTAEVVRRGEAIVNYSSDASGNVTGNWTGQMWVWDWALGRYVVITQNS